MARLIVGFEGKHPPPEVARMAARGQLAGVCLFTRNFDSGDELRALVREIQALFTNDFPPLICVDQEGGAVQRIKAPQVPEFPLIPTMREAGEKLHAAALEIFGRQIATDLSKFGINVNFAPVLDIDTNLASPVIGQRAFGTTASDVVKRALPFARGLRLGGVIPCGKHFPGHGDTSTDSHVTLPVIDHDAERLAAVELVPFAAAANAGLPMLMTAHVVFAALDAQRPATLSPIIIPLILRRTWGYEGVVVSDDLDMAAVKSRFDIATIAAGIDSADIDLAMVCKDVAFAEDLAGRLGARPRSLARIGALRSTLPSLAAPLASA